MVGRVVVVVPMVRDIVIVIGWKYFATIIMGMYEGGINLMHIGWFPRRLDPGPVGQLAGQGICDDRSRHRQRARVL